MPDYKTIEKYDNGLLTLDGVYEACETDLEFYNFLANHCCMDDYEIRDQMGSDAYENAMAQAEDLAYV